MKERDRERETETDTHTQREREKKEREDLADFPSGHDLVLCSLGECNAGAMLPSPAWCWSCVQYSARDP